MTQVSSVCICIFSLSLALLLCNCLKHVLPTEHYNRLYDTIHHPVLKLPSFTHFNVPGLLQFSPYRSPRILFWPALIHPKLCHLKCSQEAETFAYIMIYDNICEGCNTDFLLPSKFLLRSSCRHLLHLLALLWHTSGSSVFQSQINQVSDHITLLARYVGATFPQLNSSLSCLLLYWTILKEHFSIAFTFCCIWTCAAKFPDCLTKLQCTC